MSAARAFLRLFLLELRTGWVMKVGALAVAGFGWWYTSAPGRTLAPERALCLLFALGCATGWVRSRAVDVALLTAPTAGLLGVIAAQGVGLLVVSLGWDGFRSVGAAVELGSPMCLGYASTLVARAGGRGARVLAGPLVALVAVGVLDGFIFAGLLPYLPPGTVTDTPPALGAAVVAFLALWVSGPLAVGFLVVALRRQRGVGWGWAEGVLLSVTLVGALAWGDRAAIAAGAASGEDGRRTETPPSDPSRFTLVAHPAFMLLSHVELDGRRVGPLGGMIQDTGPAGTKLIVRPGFYGWPGALALGALDGSARECGGEIRRGDPQQMPSLVWRPDGRAMAIPTDGGWLSIDLDSGCGAATRDGLAWLGSKRVWTEQDAVVIDGREVGRRAGARILMSTSFAAGLSGEPGAPHTPFMVRETGLVDLEGSVSDVNFWAERRGGVCARRAVGVGCDASRASRDVASEAAPPDPLRPACGRREEPPDQEWTCWRLRDGRRFVHPPGRYPVDVDLSAMNPGLLDLETGGVGEWPGEDPWFAERSGRELIGLKDPSRCTGRELVLRSGSIDRSLEKTICGG